MKKLLNTLYITRQESYLHKERETIVIKNGDDKLAQFPALTIGNILCFGQISVSPFLMGYCAEQGIGLAFYTEYGRFMARVQGKQTGNVLLRREQYRWADDADKQIQICLSGTRFYCNTWVNKNWNAIDSMLNNTKCQWRHSSVFI